MLCALDGARWLGRRRRSGDGGGGGGCGEVGGGSSGRTKESEEEVEVNTPTLKKEEKSQGRGDGRMLVGQSKISKMFLSIPGQAVLGLCKGLTRRFLRFTTSALANGSSSHR
jgi:hypothetical protein